MTKTPEKKKRIVLPVHDMKAKVVEEIELDPQVFDGKVNKSVLYQVITAYRANARMGKASTKTRKEVSGGGKKPWRQKGTGRARHASIRSPLWRHGGIVFGPHPRDFGVRVPQKMRREALRSSLNAKIAGGTLALIERFHVLSPKTKEFVQTLRAFKADDARLLCVVDSITDNIRRATNNLQNLYLTDPQTLNALEVVNAERILMSRDSLKNITKRLKDV
ncbi:MAG: 50S ribosomal protein L4 [Deltaproteobacteria bacterium]